MPVQSGRAANALALSSATHSAAAAGRGTDNAAAAAINPAPAARRSARNLCVMVFPRSVGVRASEAQRGAIVLFDVDQAAAGSAALHRMKAQRDLVARLQRGWFDACAQENDARRRFN